MFDVVADVEAYPQFLPLCKGLQIQERGQEGDHDLITARMEVGYKAIKESFVSRVLLNREDMLITVTYLEGPISHLVNHWTFRNLAAAGSEVDFYLEYQFRNYGLQLLMGSMFDTAFSKFAESFEKRAEAIYG